MMFKFNGKRSGKMIKGLKSSLAIFLSIILIAGVLAGCGSNGTATTDSGASSAQTSVESSTGNVYEWGDANFEAAVRKVAEGKTIKIGFTPPAASEFYDIIQHGAYTEMNELHDRFGVNFQFDFASPSEHEAVESQVATIENWTSKKYDAIAVCSAGDYASMNSVYKKAEDAGSNVYMFNMPAELWKETEINTVSVVGYNNTYQSGYLVGEYAAQKLNGKGKILLIWGLQGHWSTARKNGFMEAIKKYPDMQIVGEQRGDYVRDKGMRAAENLLAANPDVNLIYGENEEMAQGAAQAVQARGLKMWDGKSGIMVIGADGLKSGYDAIRNGNLTATVNVGPVDQGRELVKAIFMHEILGYSVDKILNIPTNVIDKSNVDVVAAYTDWALAAKENYK